MSDYNLKPPIQSKFYMKRNSVNHGRIPISFNKKGNFSPNKPNMVKHILSPINHDLEGGIDKSYRSRFFLWSQIPIDER